MPLFSRGPVHLALVTCIVVVFVYCLSSSRPLSPSASLRTVLTDQTSSNSNSGDEGASSIIGTSDSDSNDNMTSPPLTISLHPVHADLKPYQTAALDVTITNTDTTNALTVLTWNTPLDPRASLLGVFEVVDTQSGQQLETQTLMISRMRPPPAEDLVELAPQQALSTQVTLNGIELDAGREYSIRAKGRWQAVWSAPKDEVVADTERLRELSGAMRGGFESEAVKVTQQSG